MPRGVGKAVRQKVKNLSKLVTKPSGSRRKNATREETPPAASPSPPRRARRKNATREPPRSPSPSPPLAEDDVDDADLGGGEASQHSGGEDTDVGGGEASQHSGGEDVEEDSEEDLSEEEDEGLGGLPFEPDPSLAWDPPEEEEYVAPEERLRPRDKGPYQRGKTTLPHLKTWSSSDCVLAPGGKR